MRRLIGIPFVLSLVFLTSGCAVFMAARGQEHKDTSVLSAGTPRDNVMAELGAPAHTEETAEGLTDIYKFVQGDPQSAKALRAIGHGVADVFTLGLWELAGTPIEGSLDGQQIAVKVTYDANKKVKEVLYLKKD